jgi:hypothetical protein
MRRLLVVLFVLLGLTLATSEAPPVSQEGDSSQITLSELLRYLDVYGWKFSFFPKADTQWMTAQIVRVSVDDGRVTPLSSQFSIQSWRAIERLDITLLLDYRALRDNTPMTGMLSLNDRAFALTFAKSDLTDFVIYGSGDGGRPLMIGNEMILLARFPEGAMISSEREAMLEYVRLEINEYVRWEVGSRD